MTLLSMIRGIACALLVLLAGYVHAQQSCSQKLIRAEDLYNEGRLLEIEREIDECLKTDGFTEAEAIRARKLLTKVAIFMDNETKAEEELILLLELDPVHKLQAEDPNELRVLLDKFRTWPVYRIEVKGGGNLAMVGTPRQFSVLTKNASEKSYGESLGIGFQVETNITKYIGNGVEIGAGFQFRSSKYNIVSNASDAIVYESEGIDGADWGDYILDSEGFFTEITNSQSMLRLPLFARYNFNYTYKGERIFTPFIFAGVSVDYLLSAKYTDASRTGGTAVTISGADADLKKFNQVNDLNTSIFAGIGAKLAMKKGNFAFAEMRYDKSLFLYNNPAERYSNQKIFGDLLFIEDDVFLNFVSVNGGLIISIFKPEKIK